MGYLADELAADEETAGETLARQLAEADYDLIAALRRVRESLGLSQTQLGVRLGVTQATVSAFESGDTEARMSTVRRYAHALNAYVEHRVVASGVEYTRTTWSGRAHTPGSARLGVTLVDLGPIAANKQSAFVIAA